MKFLNIKSLSVLMFFLFVGALVVFPQTSRQAAGESLILCGNVLIPSLFPITVCILFIANYPFDFENNKADRITFAVFGLSLYELFMFLLSVTGGYPMGAKLLNEMCVKNEDYGKRAKYMQSYFVNAGAGFIIVAVGEGIYSSKQIGILLYFSHILSSLFICIFMSFPLKKIKIKSERPETDKAGISDIFVGSVSKAADTLILICAFTVFFGVATAIFEKTKLLKPLNFFLEISNALKHCENIYFVSFLLGFSGLSVFCQILSVAKNYKINILSLFVSRIVHGALSAFMTFVFVKIFKIRVQTVSNGVSFNKSLFVSDIPLTVCLILLALLLIISTQGKNNGGNLRKDLVK